MNLFQIQIKKNKQFFCPSCKHFYSEIEAHKDIAFENYKKKIPFIIGEEIQNKFCDIQCRNTRYLCPICMIPMIPICPFCKYGLMIKPEIPKTTDYNEQGIIEAFCSNCGKGYIYFNNYFDYNKKIKISKKNIHNLIIKIYMKNNRILNDYEKFEEQIYQDFNTRSEIINFLMNQFPIEKNFIEENLHGQIFLG